MIGVVRDGSADTIGPPLVIWFTLGVLGENGRKAGGVLGVQAAG